MDVLPKDMVTDLGAYQVAVKPGLVTYISVRCNESMLFQYIACLWYMRAVKADEHLR